MKPLRWTGTEDTRLGELAADGLSGGETASVLHRPEGGVRARAAKLGVKFDSTAHQALRTFLAAGGRLLREDVGGSIGVRWCCAHRSGPSFHAPLCERLLALGVLGPDRDGRTFMRKGR